MTEPVGILYRDRYLVICVKPAGVLSEASDDLPSLPRLLAGQLGERTVAAVHRLDRNVGGTMVFSLNPSVTGKLSAQLADKTLCKKEYLAAVKGIPEKEEDTLTDLLFHDRFLNKTFVVDRRRSGVKEAVLSYRTLRTDGENALLSVSLLTGRTHQIRAQLAARSHPLLGDGKYGGGSGSPALWSHRLTLPHPVTGKLLSFSSLPKTRTLGGFSLDFTDDP